MREKSRITSKNTDRIVEINGRILEIINQNRRTLLSVPIGSGEWWKNVDCISQRRRKSVNVNLDRHLLVELNDYFANLCQDTSYVEPIPMVIGDDVNVPEISEIQVWNNLKHLKKTATGPDLIPYWIWKERAEIMTPIIHKIWNLSLKSSTWPSSWKKANINPLPKVEMPKHKAEFRGINITPVIARAFEKSVYNIHTRDTVEQSLSSNQYAYRKGGSCEDALLSMQHEIHRYLDNQNCKAVRFFTMDFSKAFDTVRHELLACKLKRLPLNPYIINWYLSFLNCSSF